MSGERASFELVASAVASARDVIDAPPVYGAFRLLDLAGQIAEGSPGDAYLERLAREIRAYLGLVMTDQDRFVAAVDALLADVAGEALRRNAAVE